MARFEVVYRSLVGTHLLEPGAIVDLDPNTTTAAPNLRPLDEDARAMRAADVERSVESAPAGSALANELRRAMLADRPATESELRAMYTYPRRSP